MKKLLLGISLAGMVGSASGTVYWRDSNDGTLGANWVNGFGTGGGVTPGAADTAILTANDVSDTTVIYVDSVVTSPAEIQMRDRGATLQIRSGGSLTTNSTLYASNYNQGNFTLSVQGGSLSVDKFNPGGAGADRFTLNVSSGYLNANNQNDPNTGGIYTGGGATVNISGGTVDLGGTGRIQVFNGVGAFNLTGGTIQGVGRFIGDNATASTVTNAGGTLFVNNNVRTDDLASYNNGTGTTVFGIENDGSTNAQLSQYSGGGVWDLTTGTVAVDFGTYTPLVGDSWDFTSIAGSEFLGDAANIASLSADGQWNITWDTSNWVNGGVLGVDGVSVIPEPSSFALLGGLLALGLVVSRRRARS